MSIYFLLIYLILQRIRSDTLKEQVITPFLRVTLVMLRLFFNNDVYHSS